VNLSFEKKLNVLAAVLGALVMLVAEHRTQAQNVPRVGWIFPGISAPSPSNLAGYKENLHDHGYVESRNSQRLSGTG
jgi:hypothetical protein